MIKKCDFETGIIKIEIEDGKYAGKIVDINFDDCINIYNVIDEVKNLEEIECSLKQFSEEIEDEVEQHYMLRKELEAIYKEKKQDFIKRNQSTIMESSLAELVINKNIDEIIESEVVIEEKETRYKNKSITEALNDDCEVIDDELNLKGKTAKEINELLGIDEDISKYII